MENETAGALVPYAGVIIRLLQGTVFDEDRKTWQALILFQSQVRAYFKEIGVDLHLDEGDGFAYLTQPDTAGGDTDLPRLVRRMPLSYEVTLLLVLLRECLEEFDVKATDSARCFITRGEILEKIELLFKDRADKVKLTARFDSYINQAVQLGFLREIRAETIGEDDRSYEIRRVIRAKLNNETLEEIKTGLEDHAEPV